MTLQERLTNIDKMITSRIMKEPTTEDSFVVDMRLKLTEGFIDVLAQAIEKDILELIGEDEEEINVANRQLAVTRNELRAELRLKLKVYIGETLDD